VLAQLLRREARILVAPVAGIMAFALTAILVEAFTDRDWDLSGLEWPEDFVITILLVCASTLVFGAVQVSREIRRRESVGVEER
jgi:hypothetical protein